MTNLKDAKLVVPPDDGRPWLPYKRDERGRWFTEGEKFGRTYVPEASVQLMIDTYGFKIDS